MKDAYFFFDISMKTDREFLRTFIADDYFILCRFLGQEITVNFEGWMMRWMILGKCCCLILG